MDSSNLNQIEQSDKYGGFPMKWHKFLIYFLLWFLFVSLLLHGTREILYPVILGGFWNFFSLILCWYYGISLFVFASYALFARIRLANLKRDGPVHVFILPLVLIFSFLSCEFLSLLSLLLVYNFPSFSALISSIHFSPLFYLRLVIDFFVIIPLAILTFIYYKKRKSLFVN